MDVSGRSKDYSTIGTRELASVSMFTVLVNFAIGSECQRQISFLVKRIAGHNSLLRRKSVRNTALGREEIQQADTIEHKHVDEHNARNASEGEEGASQAMDLFLDNMDTTLGLLRDVLVSTCAVNLWSARHPLDGVLEDAGKFAVKVDQCDSESMVKIQMRMDLIVCHKDGGSPPAIGKVSDRGEQAKNVVAAVLMVRKKNAI